MIEALDNELTENLDKLHTTDRGIERIKKNIGPIDSDAVEWCRSIIMNPGAVIKRQGKNWYVYFDGLVITVNASSYTIITAHKYKY